jgi:hypothetical protein
VSLQIQLRTGAGSGCGLYLQPAGMRITLSQRTFFSSQFIKKFAISELFFSDMN